MTDESFICISRFFPFIEWVFLPLWKAGISYPSFPLFASWGRFWSPMPFRSSIFARFPLVNVLNLARQWHLASLEKRLNCGSSTMKSYILREKIPPLRLTVKNLLNLGPLKLPIRRRTYCIVRKSSGCWPSWWFSNKINTLFSPSRTFFVSHYRSAACLWMRLSSSWASDRKREPGSLKKYACNIASNIICYYCWVFWFGRFLP